MEPTSIQKIMDIDELKEEDVIDIFKKNSNKNDVFLSLIETYVGIKVSPSKAISASIDIPDEFAIETIIERISKTNPKPKRLFLLINSLGGLVQSSYKVAIALRKSFKEIIVFVPHIAASGGTLISLAGDKIVMGMMSQITPIDPQSNGGIPALSVLRGFNTLTEFLETISEDDVPYSYKVLAKNYTAIQLDLALSNLELIKSYAKEILKEAKYSEKQSELIAEKLIRGCRVHSEVITLDKAKTIGLKVVPNTDYLNLWNGFRLLLGEHLFKGTDKHIIRYWVNK